MTRLDYGPFNRIGAVAPAVGFGVGDVLKDCAEAGLLEELRAALGLKSSGDDGSAIRAVRDLVYELAGAKSRDLAVDVLIHATGIAEFDCVSLRDYARKHGLTPEGFRQHVLKMQRRLGLPPRPMQHAAATDAARRCKLTWHSCWRNCRLRASIVQRDWVYYSFPKWKRTHGGTSSPAWLASRARPPARGKP